MSTPPALLVSSTVDFLGRHAPFDQMDAADLKYLAARMRLGYYAKGDAVTSPQNGTAQILFIVQRGGVRGQFPPEAAAAGANAVELGPGEAFPISAVLGSRATVFVYTAVEDTFCFEVDAATVEEVVRRSAPFRRFCGRHMASLLAQSGERLQAYYSQQALGQQSMLAPLTTAMMRSPVVCLPGMPLGEALAHMQRNQVGSVVVATAAGEPRGIFTERDLLRCTVEQRIDLARPIDGYMTPNPIYLPGAATVSDAALLMARHGIRHVLVVEQGRLVGVVSERSLFALQRLSMRQIVRSIELARDSDGLRQAAAEIRQLAQNMLAQGIAAEQLTQFIATLNDKLTARIIELARVEHALADLRFCWMALGSEGRHEQTFSTDQDNAIVFDAAGEPPGKLRARLLPFAAAVNATLDACGFPLCLGNIMASNPECCLSSDEWRERFSQWVRAPQPQALLNATIFFDFRALAGEAALAESLRGWLIGLVKKDERFLKMLAQSALTSRPPLGFFGDIVAGEGHLVDLKGQGTRPFIDAARIFALAAGSTQTNTAARLREAGVALKINAEEVDALIDAFHFVLLLRLRHQHLEAGATEARDAGNVNANVAGAHGSRSANHVDPAALNELDRRILKESFRQARKLQQRLALDYSL